jgi:hypothetical protein
LLRRAGFNDFVHLRVIDLGFEKGHSLVTEEAISRVVTTARSLLS